MLSEEDRAMRGKLEAMLSGDARIQFAPAVEHRDVARVLAGYDVLLCPSLWLEGGPTVAMEAQAVGTPVIGSRMGGLAEIVEDGTNGRLLPPGDTEALASCIREIAEDPERVGRWRRRLPSPRTMDEVAHDYVRLYREGSA
jgi:glycosyltransferase involved in cell wall biosynthesis